MAIALPTSYERKGYYLVKGLSLRPNAEQVFVYSLKVSI